MVPKLSRELVAPLLIAGLAASVVAGGCGIGDLPFAQVDPASIPPQPSYVRDIAPRMNFFCTACHDADGATATWDFSSLTQVCGSMPLIISVAFDTRSMPPGAAERMEARDRAVLEKWKTNNCPQCSSDDDCAGARKCLDDAGTKVCGCFANAECGPSRRCDSNTQLCVAATP